MLLTWSLKYILVAEQNWKGVQKRDIKKHVHNHKKTLASDIARKELVILVGPHLRRIWIDWRLFYNNDKEETTKDSSSSRKKG